MQRPSYLIALSHSGVEGGKFARGESHGGIASVYRPPVNGRASAEQARELLGTFLGQVAWPAGSALLILPSEEISMRQLEFAFNTPKKIRQILPFELQNELLHDLEEFSYDFKIVPKQNEKADVLVYLVRNAYLRGLQEELEQARVMIHGVTFSAQILANSIQVPVSRQFQVYIGGDEGFISYIVENRLEVMNSLRKGPHNLIRERIPEQEAVSIDLMKPPEPSSGETGEEELPQNRFMLALSGIRDEINRFIRIHGADEFTTVSLHGAFGQYFRWNPEEGDVSLAIRNAPENLKLENESLGILSELRDYPRVFQHDPGVNFLRRISSWVTFFSEQKGSLTAFLILALMLLSLFGGRYYLHIHSLQSRLVSVENEIQVLLHLPPPVSSASANSALEGLRTRVAKLKKGREAKTYLTDYHYDVLKLFGELSSIFKQTPQMGIDTFSMNQDRVILAGSTASYNDSEALKNRLLALERFKGRTAKITHQRSGGKIRFRLSLER